MVLTLISPRTRPKLQKKAYYAACFGQLLTAATLNFTVIAAILSAGKVTQLQRDLLGCTAAAQLIAMILCLIGIVAMAGDHNFVNPDWGVARRKARRKSSQGN